MHAVVVAILAITCTLVFKKLLDFIWNWRHSYKLGKLVPGPKGGVPLLGQGLTIAKLTTNEIAAWMFLQSQKIIEDGGSVMRFSLGNKYVFIPLDGKAIKPILDSNDEITKGDDYDFLVPWLGTGLLISTGSKWRSRRKMITPTFHFNMLNEYVSIFDREAQVLVDLLEKEVGQEFDIFPYVKRCALDIICGTAMGVTVNAQFNTNHEYVKCVGNMAWLTMQWSMKPIMWFPPYWHLSGHSYTYWSSVRVLKSFTKTVIQERKEAFRRGEKQTLGEKLTFLDSLIYANEVNKLSDEDIREEVDTFMFEGHDTTSSGIGWTLWCLACHPEVQEKVYNELEILFDGTDREITLEDLKNMPYLDRALKETLRLRPPVPLMQRALQNDFQMGEYLLPKNTTVLLAPLLIHMNKKRWGDDCFLFNPDRFNGDEQPYRHAYDYIPFSAGPRNCVGQKFAVLEEKVVVAWILRKYIVHSKRDFTDNQACPEVVLKPFLGVPIVLEKR